MLLNLNWRVSRFFLSQDRVRWTYFATLILLSLLFNRYNLKIFMSFRLHGVFYNFCLKLDIVTYNIVGNFDFFFVTKLNMHSRFNVLYSLILLFLPHLMNWSSVVMLWSLSIVLFSGRSSCPWQTKVQTRTAPSSSLQPNQRLTWMEFTQSLGMSYQVCFDSEFEVTYEICSSFHEFKTTKNYEEMWFQDS